jgi:hypothetical protein
LDEASGSVDGKLVPSDESVGAEDGASEALDGKFDA